MDEILETEFAQKELSTLKQDAGNEDSFFESNAGCTANVILIHQGTIYCANAGDSRSILYSTKMEFETDENITPLSFDHKPENPLEKDRVTKAGGFIIEGRINGNLNLSRALGDLEYKRNLTLKPSEQLISPFPDVSTRRITPEDHFIVMGCDGVWEIQSQLEICKHGTHINMNDPDCLMSKIAEDI